MQSIGEIKESRWTLEFLLAWKMERPHFYWLKTCKGTDFMAKTLDAWSHYVHISNRARYFFPVNSGWLDWHLPEMEEWRTSTFVSPYLYFIKWLTHSFPILLIGIPSAILILFCVYLLRSFIYWHHYLTFRALLSRLMRNLSYYIYPYSLHKFGLSDTNVCSITSYPLRFRHLDWT